MQCLIPPSYHLFDSENFYPIEFINNEWYYIEYNDRIKYKGYWVNKERHLAQHVLQKANVGWIGNTIGVQTPTTASLTQFRERAASGSTQPEEPSPTKEEDDEEIMDDNPGQTEALAQLFDQPYLQDITEEIDPPQDRAHYLPTTLPSIPQIRPVEINPTPLRIRTTKEENIKATTDSAFRSGP
jgi:hypothetical protein